MHDWAADLRPRLAALRLTPAREAEIIDELSQHLDDRVRDLRAAGLDDAGARRAALDELREPDALARWMRGLRQSHSPEAVTAGAPFQSIFGDLWRDVVYAGRMMRKTPAFAAAAILTLALGIGANTAVFSLVNATLLQRLPVAHRDRLANVYRGAASTSLSYPAYVAIRDGNRTLDGCAAWAQVVVSLHADGTTDLVRGAIVSGNFFELLGIAPAHGRLLMPFDDRQPRAHPVAAISDSLWRTRFAARPDIVGREVTVAGHPFTIVGVVPPAFVGPRLGMQPQLYVPMMMQPIVRPPSGGYSGDQDPDLLTKPSGWLSAIARVRSGVTFEQARDDLDAVIAASSAQTGTAPRPDANTPRLELLPVDAGDPRDQRQLQATAWLLGGVVAAVLLIACANIANLLLTRNASRQREIAIRLAIGASRGRLVRQLLTESVVVALIGGAAGVALAAGAIALLQAAPPPPGALPIVVEVAIDRRVLMFSLALSIATGIVFGVAPALTASRTGLVTAMKSGAVRQARAAVVDLKSLLVVAQVAVSLMLIVIAGLFVRSLQSAQAIDPGLDRARLISAQLGINLLRYTRAQGRTFYDAVVERVERLPGVESASVARVAVLTGGGRWLPMIVEGGDAASEATRTDPRRVNINVVGHGFFSTLGIQLRTGRDFGTGDSEGRPLVTVVNETLARQYFSGDSPLGKRVSFSGPRGPWWEIVGVARDSTYARLGESPLAAAYLPLAQNHETGMTLYVRSSVPPATLAASVRREIQALDRHLPVPNIQTMDETIGTSLYPVRMGAWLLAVFGGLALALAAIGVYGVLSFSIARRTREMGIRLALGADANSVFTLVLREGMRLVVIGVAAGAVAALAASRSVESFLYGVSARDVPTFATAIAVLMAVALIACAIPARRAVHADPIAPLRSE
jgi:predicted permease